MKAHSCVRKKNLNQNYQWLIQQAEYEWIYVRYSVFYKNIPTLCPPRDHEFV